MRYERVEIGGAVNDAVKAAAGGFGHGFGQAFVFLLFGGQQVEHHGEGLGATGGNDGVVHFFQLFLMSPHQHYGGAGFGTGAGGFGTEAL